MLADPSWVYRQYDHQLFLNTVEGPGRRRRAAPAGRPGPAAVRPGRRHHDRRQPALVRARPAGRARPWSSPRASPTWPASGRAPVAVVNCCNFGNPEHPVVMWQLSEAIDGLADACRAFGLPVIGGNVSLYNESGGARHPADAGDRRRSGCSTASPGGPPGLGWDEGSTVLLLGPASGRSADSLAGSRWAVEVRGHRTGTLPPLDTDCAPGRRRASCGIWSPTGVGGGEELLCAAHDVSAGGLGVTLAEMAIAGWGRAAHRRRGGHGAARSPRRRPASSWPPIGRTSCSSGPGAGGWPPRSWVAPAATSWLSTAWWRCRSTVSGSVGRTRSQPRSASAGEPRYGRRAASRSRTSSGTRRSPRPVPTDRPCLTVPW